MEVALPTNPVILNTEGVTPPPLEGAGGRMLSPSFRTCEDLLKSASTMELLMDGKDSTGIF